MIPAEIVPGAFDFKQADVSRNQLQRSSDFPGRGERITRTMDEQRGSAEIGKVRRSHFGRLARRMQWVREQQERIHQVRCFGGENTRLPAAVRMTAGPDSLRLLLPNFEYLFPQPCPVARRVPWPGRTMRPLLAKRKIDAQHLYVFATESIGNCYQKRSVPIRSGAVSKE